MWGKQDNQTATTTQPMPLRPGEEPRAVPSPLVRTEPEPPARIGKSLNLKAQIIGNEDLFIDGQLEGSIELKDHNLTVGINGKVNANVVARNIVVHGTLLGNVHASEKVEIRKTGSLQGDLTTAGVTIEDGAYFKGSIDISKPGGPDGKAKGK